MSGKRIFYAFVLIVVAGISALGGALAGGLAVFTAIQEHPTPEVMAPIAPSATPQTVTQQIVTMEKDTAVTQAVEQIGPAVVTVVGIVPGQQTFFGRSADLPVSGSGVFISQEGYVITNNHVVESTSEVAVILADGTQILAEIVGTDPFSDLAVLRAQGNVPAIAPLGNSDALRPGETVIAIGSPLGDFKNTVTAGVVSATERSIEVDQNYLMEGLIQTDAAINQGNSGGPLVNLAGEVVGINTLIVRGGTYGSAVAEGLGFAIPSNTVLAVSKQLIEKGYFSYPYLGIRYQWFTENIAHTYDLPVNQGLYVSGVGPGSPAGKAGLQEGDIITHMGNQKLDADHPCINVLYTFSPGDTTTLTVVRNGGNEEIAVTFGEHPTP